MARDEIPLGTVDPDLAGALQALMRHGVPSLSRLDLEDVTLAGQSRPDILHLEVQDNGELGLEIDSTQEVVEVAPEEWKTSDLVACHHGQRVCVEFGGVDYIGGTTSIKAPDTYRARIYGWEWYVEPIRESTKLWAGQLRFSSSQVPLALWFPTGNLQLDAERANSRGWRFATPFGSVFLVDRSKEWFIAFATTDRPASWQIRVTLDAIGFVFGEEMSVGVLHSVGDGGVGKGLFRFITNEPRRRTSRQEPNLPLSVSTRANQPATAGSRSNAAGYVDLVERLVAFQHQHKDAPLGVAIHHFFESLDGLPEKQLLHAWIAAEAIAFWGSAHGFLKKNKSGRVADHSQWVAWVRLRNSRHGERRNRGIVNAETAAS